MEAYSNFSAVDLALDERFLNWVRHPGMYPELDDFWQKWLEMNPNKLEEVSEARRLIAAAYEEGDTVAIRHQEDEVWERLQQSMSQEHKSRPLTRRYSFLAAASVVFVMALILTGYLFSSRQVSESATVGALITVNNSGGAVKTVSLSDGSTIGLAPNSTLSYPHVFEPSRREVTLVGRAHFDIAKNPEKPFFVFTDKVVTKVLGTKFTVSAFEGEPDILVEVQSGKVAVQVVGLASTVIQDQHNSVLLTPNQMVRYSRLEDKLSKSLVDVPLLIGSTSETAFAFKDVSIEEVFDALERAYGVTIVYDEEVMKNCYINAVLNDMSLFEKLRLICKTLEAKYEVLDSQIVITGPGCN